MLKNVTNYHYPGSLDEAYELHDRESRSFFIAGGTALALSDSTRPVELIDVSRLEMNDLKLDKRQGRLTIGATTKIQRLVESEEVRPVLGGFLSKSLEEIGSYPIRNAGTLGGSLVRPFPWSDVLPILAVLDTSVTYYHDGERGTRSFSRLYEDGFRSTLNDSVIEKITIDLPEGKNSAGVFKKFNRSEFDVAALNLACRITQEGGEVKEARLAVGARPMKARRARDVEKALIGEELGGKIARDAGKMAARKLELKDDKKISGEYRKTLVDKMTNEALKEVSKEVSK
ncbi:MAG: FAD binding domain-containing protein [Candidatus Bipolaricaulota bacterium]